jgi:hypothetical protein
VRLAGPGRGFGLRACSETVETGRGGEFWTARGFGESFGVRGGEMGSTPEVGELVLLPGGGRIRLSSSSWEKLFSRYSLPWDLYMCTFRL